MPPLPRPAMILCVEGASAAGKTTLAEALAREAGATIVPELDATGAPPVAESAAWYVERHVEQWQRARAAAAVAPLVVLDGDPFKGLWYNWVFGDAGWPGVGVVAPLYQRHVERGALAFPDLYIVLEASEAQLRQRRDDDATRSRQNCEAHLRLVRPQRRYFAALADADPTRVLLLDTGRREELVGAVMARLGASRGEQVNAGALLDHMIGWITTHAPNEP